MKCKVIIALIGLLVCSGSIDARKGSGPTYNDMKQQFKEKLYQHQHGLMSHKEYMSFIARYIQASESSLGIPAACVRRNDVAQAQAYFDALVYVNVAIFRYYVQPHKHNERKLEQYKHELLQAIEALKQLWHLEHFDSAVELQKTVDFFTQANKEYYQALGFVKRSMARVACKLAVMSV